MARHSIETEAKLDAWVGFRLPRLDGVADGVLAAPLPDRVLDAVYYDTGDLRLVRAGITVRHRSGEGGADGTWTVKLPDGPAGPVTSRREVTVEAPGRVIPDEVAKLVRATVRSAVLAPVAHLRTRRRALELRDGEGAQLAEVDDDEVSILDGPRVAARFRELEVELAPEAIDGLLDTVVGRLQEAGAAASAFPSKLVRALGPRAVAPPDVVVPHLDGDATMADVVRAAIANGTARLMAHDPGVRLGDDAEDVHQARVAVRRLRSDLRTFRPVLDAGATASLRDQLRDLAADLGAVRDADVLLERLRRQASDLPGADPAAVATLLGRLSAGREAAWERLLAVLEGDAYLTVLDALVAAAAAPPCRRAADRRAAKALPQLVRAPWARLRRAVGASDANLSVAALHAVRIQAKRCRYAAEAATPVIGKPARRFARAVAGVQEVLGDLNDAVVAEAWLRAARPSLSTSEAVVAGDLVGVQRLAIEVGRRDWRAAWEAAADRSLRTWLR
ncbi:MAG TPA: CYTH and CHAD domain-containing protein [Acidimicrobiales bacterium]|nr:CYTH and CHAD domain-containing protein [Acidimicrobiales bacterium]